MNDNPHVPVNQNGPQEEDDYEVLSILAEQDEPLQVVDDEALSPPAAYGPPRGAPAQAVYEPPPPPVRSRPPRPGRRKRGKLLLLGLAGLVVIAVVYGIFNQSAWQGAVITRISGSSCSARMDRTS